MSNETMRQAAEAVERFFDSRQQLLDNALERQRLELILAKVTPMSVARLRRGDRL